MDIIGWLFDQAPFLAPLMDSELLLGLTFVALTAALLGMGVPGVVVPLSLSSGALLGGWLGMAVVVAGAVLGSQAFFVLTRRWLAARVRAKLGDRLHKFDRELGRRGIFYVIGLRLMGAPHFLVTAGSALSPLPARSFAFATLVGILPAIALASAAGSAL